MEKDFYVYILASKPNGTLYTGVTSDLVKRLWQHREGLAEGFSNKYDVKSLVYYEHHESADSAISREKLIKKWKRDWKLSLIQSSNPQWKDLYDDIL